MSDARPVEIPDYCRQIEAYLCQKNDGHLVRVVGPSFEIVSRWSSDGVPLKVAFRGIDRYFERYYRKGPRRRPVKIDFCEADVLDVYDEWQRAVGLGRRRDSGDGEAPVSEGESGHERRGPSLPAHLERVLIRLTNARATGALGDNADTTIDRVSRELDAARASAGGLRGGARLALLERLTMIDAELLALARAGLDEGERLAFERQADEELAAFRVSMAPEAYDRARATVLGNLARERFGLPTVTYR